MLLWLFFDICRSRPSIYRYIYFFCNVNKITKTVVSTCNSLFCLSTCNHFWRLPASAEGKSEICVVQSSSTFSLKISNYFWMGWGIRVSLSHKNSEINSTTTSQICVVRRRNTNPFFFWGGTGIHSRYAINIKNTPWKINGWNLHITHLEKQDLPNTSMIMFHVNLQGCNNLY